MAFVRLRLQQALGDARAQARHRHALLGAVAQAGIGGAATAGSAALAAGAGAARRARRAGLVPAATAPSTSPLVTRPSLPVPATSPVFRLLSASSLAAAGIATSPLAAGGGGGRTPARGGGRRGRGGRERPRRAALAPAVAVGVDLGDQLFGDDGGAVGLHDLGQHAGGRRRHFEHDLVGLDLDQDLVDARRRRRPSSSIAAGWLPTPIPTAAEPSLLRLP